MLILFCCSLFYCFLILGILCFNVKTKRTNQKINNYFGMIAMFVPSLIIAFVILFCVGNNYTGILMKVSAFASPMSCICIFIIVQTIHKAKIKLCELESQNIDDSTSVNN